MEVRRLWRRLGDPFRIAVVRRLLIVVAVLLVYQAWLSIQAIGKVDDGVGAHPDDQGRYEVDVHLDFRPERFHILNLQEHGRIAGSDDEVVHLRGVSDAGVDALARFYWVDEITPGADEGDRDDS